MSAGSARSGRIRYHHAGFRVSDLEAKEEEAILVKSIETLTPLAGGRPVGWRAPAWQLSGSSLDLVAKHGAAVIGQWTCHPRAAPAAMFSGRSSKYKISSWRRPDSFSTTS